ncbi:LuxR C-terminal-related transcriptional regulator [Streptomyces sp. NBC_00704]|uniref:helix-turn-helix transcriptional regulator n=1 Tax=Streptomyces sp. NBC_00704 TaxID=2975809 RepID=UPI002E32D8CF|nr:LuxR C-terminal-related transcriptional regulator [Streptomyces sp. NBC_00704]
MSDDPRGEAPTPVRRAQGDARPLAGREAEVGALARALADLAGTGAGRSVALVGEPGIGKSALTWAAAAEARAVGIPVRTARGRTAEASAGAGEPCLTGVREVAARAAEGGPLLAVVEDFHLLPSGSRLDVERLLRAASTGPVLCLIACRQRQLAPWHAELLSRAGSAGSLEVWDIGPLSREEAGELLGDHPDAEEIHREAQGNPQYLKVLGSRGQDAAAASTAVLGELAGLDADSVAVLEAAAVLGEPFRPELPAAVVGLDVAAAVRALDTLTRVDLVRPAEPAPRLALRHRAVGDVVYERLAPSRRVILHRRAESALAEQGAPIARRAHHVARAADPDRPEHALTLIAAARELLYRSPAVAAGHLEAALPILRPGEPHRHEAQVLLARARLLTGDAAESRELLDALRSAMPDRSGEAGALADSSRIERTLGRYAEAGALARSGLATLAGEDAAIAAALHTELADHAYDLQEYVRSRHHAETAAVIARQHHDRVGEAQALAQSALGHLFTGDLATAQERTTTAAALIDAAPDSALLTNLNASLQTGMTEGMLGRLVDAERHLTRAAALSRRTGQTYVQPHILTVLANTHLRRGNLDDALAALDEVGHHTAKGAGPAEEAVSSMVRAEALSWRDGPGDQARAQESAARALAVAGASPTAWAVTVRCFHAEWVQRTGDPARSRWLLLDAAGGAGLPRLTVWRKPRWCDALAQASLAVGDRAAVGEWAELAEQCLEQLPSPGRRGFALRARMRAHAAAGRTGQALERALEAASDFSLGGERVEACVTLLAAAELSLDADRTDGVAAWLDGAGVLADQCGSARLRGEVIRWRARLAACADAADAPRVLPALSALTAREREIASLVSTGMTNIRIAESLFLSVRTVETHLGQVYRKLGVSNRTSLARMLMNGAAPGGGPVPESRTRHGR